jgi:acetyltransferase-like isoleucine patch superfamily enzyme
MRIGLRAPFWKREETAHRFAKHYDAMVTALVSHGIDLQLVAVHSQSKGYVQRIFGGTSHWQVMYHQNQPVARKCAAGLAAVRKLGVDVAINVGADDFMGISSILRIVREIQAGADFIGWSTAYIAHAKLGVKFWPGYPRGTVRADEPLGPGRALSPRLLDEIDWDPWKGAVDKNLDGTYWRRIKALRGRFKVLCLPSSELGPLVDVKDVGSWSPWAKTARYNRTVSPEEAQSILETVGLGDLLENRAMKRPEVHRTAIIHASAVIGEGTDVLPFTLIGEGARIGKNCSIGAYTEIRGGCVIGDRVRFGSKCLLADGTMIGDDSHLSGTFTTCNKPQLLDPSVKTASIMGKRFKAGVGAVIMPGVTIGDDVQVGASSTVRHDIPSGEVWFGNPARKHR